MWVRVRERVDWKARQHLSTRTHYCVNDIAGPVWKWKCWVFLRSERLTRQKRTHFPAADKIRPGKTFDVPSSGKHSKLAPVVAKLGSLCAPLLRGGD